MMVALLAVCGQGAMLLLALASWPGGRALLGRELQGPVQHAVRLGGFAGLGLDLWLMDRVFDGLFGFAVVTFACVCTLHLLVSAAFCTMCEAFRYGQKPRTQSAAQQSEIR